MKITFSISLLLTLLTLTSGEFSNGHYHWLVGNPGDFVVPNPASLTGGALLAGGGGDVDSAMRWFLRKAAGGDVIVFRNAENGTTDLDDPDADRYNAYMYSQLGIFVDSVETILFNGKWVSDNPFVIDKVRKAEAIFFRGGDQSFYYEFLEGTTLLSTLNDLINVKRAVIGGTSAGCAIQTEYGFTAAVDTVSSAEALSNPYDARVTLNGKLFRNKWLENTVVDQHYADRNRFGRHVTFMARVLTDHLQGSALIRGIGVDERTAVAVDRTFGIAYAFGSQHAYFVQQMNSHYEPEICEANRALHWYRDGRALNVYRIQADDSGTKYFDLGSWDRGLGGNWMHMYVNNGQFFLVD